MGLFLTVKAQITNTTHTAEHRDWALLLTPLLTKSNVAFEAQLFLLCALFEKRSPYLKKQQEVEEDVESKCVDNSTKTQNHFHKKYCSIWLFSFQGQAIILWMFHKSYEWKKIVKKDVMSFMSVFQASVKFQSIPFTPQSIRKLNCKNTSCFCDRTIKTLICTDNILQTSLYTVCPPIDTKF